MEQTESFLTSLERDYPINTAFQAVAWEVHAILWQKRMSGPAESALQLQLLEKMMDVNPDTTGIVHGHQLAVIDHIRWAIWFSELLKLGEKLKTNDHKIFFSRLIFSYMGSRLEKPDVALEADLDDFWNYCRVKWFDLMSHSSHFIQKSPAYTRLFLGGTEKVAA